MREYIDIVSGYLLNEAWSPELTAKNYGAKLKTRMLADPSLKNVGLEKVSNTSVKPDMKGLSNRSLEIFNKKTAKLLTNLDIIDFFAQFDPTKKKFYLLNWIIPKYLSNGIVRLEDLEGVRTDLEKYHELKHLMEIKDIKQIPDASTLSKIVRKVIMSLEDGGIFVPKEESDAAKAESIFVHENEDFVVVIPLTQRAAGYWGRYSEWCTAYGYKYGFNSSKTSYFKNYDGNGQHLLIFFDKKAEYEENEEGEIELHGVDRSVQCFYGSGEDDELQIANIDDNDISGDIDNLLRMIPLEGRKVIVANCLKSARFFYKDEMLVKEFDNISEIIEQCGNDTAKWAAEVLINGEYPDWTDGYSSLDDCIEALPIEAHKLLQKYILNKYRDFFDEDKEHLSPIEIINILEENEDEEEELIDLIKRCDLHARETGAESEMYEYFTTALKNAGVIYENFDDSPVYIQVDFVDYMNNPKENKPDDVKMNQPYYGFSGYDDKVFDDSELKSFLEK